MYSLNKDIGNHGEDLSVRFLLTNGHKILKRNYKNRFGEIDIISSFKDLIIFTEVKSRYTTSYGLPLEAVTYSKQKQILRVSTLFISSYKLYNNNFRFDVIEVMFNTKNDSFTLNHIPDAFRC